ncbi:MAG: orotidine-5'-phosphate decarboxylase [Clostridiales Family XIII bacterium]|jgi:orotidine-5'-phosphate decarboxylase|nr:orotidine-5'-phosphate decarboxylase [Clostridiales Family XIII bacterium]
MIDRLIENIERLGAPVVVGLDPTLEIVPEKMLADSAKSFDETTEAAAFALLKFNREIIDAVADIVPAVKPNIAFYERYGLDGIRAYIMTVEYAMGRGLMVIGDIKRGDIGSTAAAYAGHVAPSPLFGRKFEIWNEDAVTLNPYLGADSITPFLDAIKGRDKGVFILVKTSNPGGADLQDLPIMPEGAPLYERVAALVGEWGAGEGLMGGHGYSRVGAVVGATHPKASARLRELMPHTFFLVPGYGAQGASASDIKQFFDTHGRGAIVSSSRGIIGAWKAEGKGAGHVGKSARAAALKMRDEIGAVL